ncbi:MAG: glycosyltransferase [Candidatus Heimdallarchaeota archaeon]|nr:glycosyltransferase [Candidatus Heimdallarchaeota archaeon]
MGLKILHIWMSADVAVTMSKELKKRGHDVRILISENADPFGWREAAPELVHTTKTDLGLFLKVIRKIFFFRPDIVHIHGMLNIVKWVRYVYKKIPIVMHFHGTDIREVWDVRMPDLLKLNIGAYVVASEDLLRGAPKDNVYFIANPVDEDLFTRTVEGNNNKALFISINEIQGLAEERARKYAKDKLNMELEVLDRTTSSIPYIGLKDYLQQFAAYLDFKIDGMFGGSKEEVYEDRENPYVTCLSLTAYQALALGIIAVDYNDEVHTELPVERTPAHAVDILEKIYYDVLKNK